MSLRVACDLDGTVADMDVALQREARRLFGPDVALHAFPGDRMESAEDVEGHMTSDPAARTNGGPRALTAREVRRLWEHVATLDDFWTSLGEVEPGAVAQLATAARTLRWEVIFLTQRPSSSAGETTQVQSQRWLQTHGFDMPSVMVMRGSRGKVAEAFMLDALIDDRTENCLDVLSDSKAKPILVWRPGLTRIPPAIAGLPIEAVSSMADALAYLQGMTAERERGQTLVGRLKKALGRTP